MKSKRLEGLHNQMVKESKAELRESRLSSDSRTADNERKQNELADRVLKEGVN